MAEWFCCGTHLLFQVPSLAGRRELKINAEQELLMLQLNLKLQEATVINPSSDITNPALSYA